MLIKRTERQARRGTLAAAAAGPIRWRARPPRLPAQLRPRCRRRSPRSARCRSAACARPRPDRRRRAGAQVTIRKNICTHCSVGCTVIAEVANGVWIGQEPGWDSPINRGSHCAKGAAVRELVHGDRRLRYPMKLVNGQWTTAVLGPGHRRDRRQADGDPREVGPGVGLLARLRQVLQRRRLSQSQACRLLGHQQRPTTRRASATRPPSRAWPIPGATAR